VRYSKMGMADVRFGSKVDIVPCGTDVRFTPNSDRMLRCRKVSLSAISDQSAPHKKMQTQTLHIGFSDRARCHDSSASRRPLASFKSGVSKPSVNLA